MAALASGIRAGGATVSFSAQAATITETKSDIQQHVQQSERSLQQFSRKEVEIAERLHRLEAELHKTRQDLSAVQQRLADLDEQTAATNAEVRQLDQRIARGEAYARKRVASLYKLDRIGRVGLLASAESITEFFRRKRALEYILESDQELLRRLASQQRRLTSLSDQIRQQRQERQALERSHQEKLALLNQKKSDRESMLAEIKSHKNLLQASLLSIRKAAELLDEKLAAISDDLTPSQTENGFSGPRFSTAKGLLNPPVTGRIVSHFGPSKDPDSQIEQFQSGIQFQAERGEPVRSVWEGRVVFADWFKGYGNMIIINHGEHYYSLYAHADELFKKKGDRIERREVIGTVGDSGSLNGTVLHFEIRHHGKPVDPLNWLKKG